jgi:tryptophan synthase alpha chain
MSCLERTFASLKASGRTGFIPYVTAGDPRLDLSAEILLALDRAGADVLEVGVPFSDPIADGPVIQRACSRALAAGATVGSVLDLVASVKPRLSAPIILFTYANPIFRYGIETFVAHACRAGVAGVLVVDLPVEEIGPLKEDLQDVGIHTILLVSPTTSNARMKRIVSLASGFLYVVSRLGVTGNRSELSGDVIGNTVSRIRRETDLPVALGFGINRPEHVRIAARWADAAVVGSSLVQVIEDSIGQHDTIDRVGAHVRWLKGTSFSHL